MSEKEYAGAMVDQETYMNIATGSIDTCDGWWYDNENGERVNAVDLGEVVEVKKNESGDWVEV